MGSDGAELATAGPGQALPRGLQARVTCPHCWHAFAPDQLLFVSQHAELLGDPVLGPDAAARFRPSRFNLRGEAIDARENACQTLACPRCHLTIPRVLVERRPLFLSIVGAPGSGKSHLLTCMAWELRRVLPARFGISFVDADAVANQCLNEYEQTLFLQEDGGRLVAIRKTELQGSMYDQIRLGQQTVTLPRPFIFTLRRPPRPATPGGHGPTGGRIAAMCLYDNAGEHFQPGTDTPSAPGTRHLAHSQAIFFLFDPTQDPRFRERCRPVSDDPQLHGSSRSQRQELILTEAATRVRRHAGLAPEARHQRPLLVLVSKADVWLPLLGTDLAEEPFVRADAGGTASAVDLRRVEQVSAQVRALLLRVTPELVTAAEDFCRHVVYIPVSALGRGPEVDAATGALGIRPRDIRPRWVTVPLLYMLARWSSGLVEGRPAPAAAGNGAGAEA